VIEFAILDNRYNKIIDSQTSKEVIEKAINDKKMKKIQEFKNYVNDKIVRWYKHSDTEYILIYEE
jgi:hypothetical protein